MHPEDQTRPAGLSIVVGGYSSAGTKVENQDAFCVHTPETASGQLRGAVACIADGASCSEQAALASQTAVNTFISDYLSTPESWSVCDSASRVISSLNSWMYNQSRSSTVREDGLISTFSSLVFKSNTAFGFHVGDSRIFRWRDHTLEQLTRDHHIGLGKNEVLTRALGMDSHLEVDHFKEPSMPGDLYILTTDGVHNWVALGSLLSSQAWQTALHNPTRAGLEQLSQHAVNEALAAGSPDNLTCLAIYVNSLPELALEEIHQRLTDKVIPPPMEAGNRIDNYEIESILHMGTRSTVYRVRELGTARRLAMKVPGEKFSDDTPYLESFQRECWIAQRVNHDSLVKPYLPVQESRFLYQLYEYVEGPTLRQWMYDNPKPALDCVRSIVEPLISALRALQRRGMVHRDLKPENIIVQANGVPVIIDYGTVQVAGLKELTTPSQTGFCPEGSADYIAPEYLLENTAISASDLFSLAVITYEMLSGKLPYRFSNMTYRTPKSYDEWSYRPLHIERHDLPRWLDYALQKALAARPVNRQQAFSEYQQDLRQANPDLLAKAVSKPLIERHPVAFWKTLCGVLALIVLVELYFLVSPLT